MVFWICFKGVIHYDTLLRTLNTFWNFSFKKRKRLLWRSLCTSIIIMFFPCFFHRLFPYREWMERIYYKLYSSKPLKALAPQLFPTLRPHGLTTARQALPSIGFSRQEYWSGLPFPSPGYLPDPEIEHGSPHIAGSFLPSEPPTASAH